VECAQLNEFDEIRLCVHLIVIANRVASVKTFKGDCAPKSTIAGTGLNSVVEIGAFPNVPIGA